VYRTAKLLPGVARVSIKNKGSREINCGNGFASSRPDRITPGTLWIRASNDKNVVYPTAQLLPGVSRVSIKNEGIREIINGNCISASRPDRITHGNQWIGASNDNNVVYPTAQLLLGLVRGSIKLKEFLK
jgi:hypothetical protein